MTTSERAITIPISEFVSAWRKSNGSTTSAIAHRTRRRDRERDRVLRARHVGKALLDELAARRQRRAAQEHRRHDEHEDEQLLDAGPAPRPSLVGNHDFVDAYSISDSSIPMPRPQAHAIANEVSLAKRAAARAGTTRNGSVVVSSAATEPAKIPSVPSSEAGEQRVRERQLVRRQTREAGGDVVLRRRPRREPEARPAVERPEHERHRDDDAAEHEGGQRHRRIEHADRPGSG